MTAASVAVAQRASEPKASAPLTLRNLLDARRKEGRTFSLDEAIAIIVPLCLDLKERHDRGEKLYVHPSCIAPGSDGLAKIQPSLAILPTHAHDRACMAPELQRSLAPGDSRASVFSVGAVLYEMVTNKHIGPGMQRPREVDPTLPDALEVLLAKALVGDPAHRPDDLGALASAMHHIAPMKSIHPPDIDPALLDHGASFEVDIRLSMLPPSEIEASPPIPRAAPMPMIDRISPPVIQRISTEPVSSRNDPTTRLSQLKMRLEADPRPRYVVSKDKMDHGPFTAVELLQQIASNQFVSDNGLRDEISGQSRLIKEWEEFSPFAEQAALKRDIVAEKKEVARVVEQEKAAGTAKSTIGIVVVVALVAVGAVFVIKAVGSKKDDIAIADDKAGANMDPAGSIKGQKRNKPGGGGGGGSFGGGGQSFEAAWAKAEQKVDLAGGGQRDLTLDELSRPMQNASFINGCGAPDSMHVHVVAAVQNGHPVGVTVTTSPPNAGVASCVDHAVRGIAWPVSPNMDKVETNY